MNSTAQMICKRCLVSGRVQGVFFRVSTAKRAQELAITGSAVNLPDGKVEVLAYGAKDDVKLLCKWLWQGPPGASVGSVECESVEISENASVPTAFSTF